ncbi:uncharacterized protein LOC110461793 [Mizuhopecten yessoensis]|uniref:uncharacterized protein LOC110461793 n=1 Tax=Mizuhopecten yessoensis TaxID=6573 RepID=UPI000B4597CA|nr:uncharacterized protein LOC110461793 [Mizuhopecten yessoensis]
MILSTVVILLGFLAVCALCGTNCTMNDGLVTFCEKGCCEHQDYRYCCPLNATTIAEVIVGSAIGVGILIFVIGVCVICTRRKSNPANSGSIFDVNADYQRLMERDGNESNFPNTYM